MTDQPINRGSLTPTIVPATGLLDLIKESQYGFLHEGDVCFSPRDIPFFDATPEPKDGDPDYEDLNVHSVFVAPLSDGAWVRLEGPRDEALEAITSFLEAHYSPLL